MKTYEVELVIYERRTSIITVLADGKGEVYENIEKLDDLANKKDEWQVDYEFYEKSKIVSVEEVEILENEIELKL